MVSSGCRDYGASRGFKICCWIAVIGAIFVVVSYATILPRWIELTRKEIAGNALAIGILAVVPVVLLFVYRWRLRIDVDGIWRRRLFGWDLWSRADLASGRIRKGDLQSRSLYDPNRSSWSRYLRLDLLSDSDFGEVLNEINKSYRLPPPPLVPDKLELRYGFRKSATFEESGIQLKHGRVVRNFKWSDVEDIHIHRWEPVRHDFLTALITLPGDEIALSYFNYNGDQRPAWKGATAEEISEFFLSCPASDRVHVSSELEGWNRLRDVDRILRNAKRRSFWVGVVAWGLTAFCAIILAQVAISDGVATAITMALVLSVPIGPIILWSLREWRQRIDKLENRRVALMNDALALRI